MESANILKMKKFILLNSTQIIRNTTLEYKSKKSCCPLHISSSVMNKFVPNFHSVTKSWMTRKCKTVIQRKHRLYNYARHSNSTLDWDKVKNEKRPQTNPNL